jgi:Tol biopolymer transport system component
MITIDRFERELPAALSDVAGTGRSDYLNDILGRTARTRQRPAWASLERWLPVNIAILRVPVTRVPWRPFVAAVLVLLLVVALLAVYLGGQRRVPPPFGPAGNGLIPYTVDGNLYVGDPITGSTRLLVDGSDDYAGPSFSSDGAIVAFLHSIADGVDDILVVDADGRNVRKISAEPVHFIDYAQWIPGTHSIIVSHRVADRYRLDVFEATGGTAPRMLLQDAKVLWAISRPPTGREILLDAKVDGLWGLYTIPSDGGVPRLLQATSVDIGPDDDPGQDLNFPAYSPDGSRIYYNRYVAQAQTIQAWVMDADGANKHRFNTSGPASGWWEGEMAPSPDGKWVLMWRVGSSSGNAITLFPADGSGDGVVIGPHVTDTAHWLWSPDSTKVLLNFNQATEGDQGLIDVTTGRFTALPWRADTEPDWQRVAQ